MPTRPGRQPSIRHGALSAVLLFSYLTANVQAVELGNLRVHSLLGRQLKASVPLTGDDARESEARCFKAALVNMNREPLSTLKVTLQHFSNGSVLLLSGGAAIDEPAAMVVVENSCGAASTRDYALLLDPAAPAAASASTSTVATPTDTMKEGAAPTPPLARNVQPERRPDSANHPDGLQNRKPAVRSAFLYAIPGMPTMKMAALLADPDRDKISHAGAFSPGQKDGAQMHQPTLTDSSPHARLRMDRSLAGTGWAGLNGADASDGQKAWIIGALSLIALLGAAAWIVMRVREMRSTAKPWIPGDAPSKDSDAETRNASSMSS